MIRTCVLAAVAALALTAPAFAQTAVTSTHTKLATTSVQTTKSGPAKAKGPATTAAKTPESKACSSEADAKGLHGKARKKFRSKCKEEAKSGGDKASTTPSAATAKH